MGNVDGYVVIGTKLDSKHFESELKQLYKKLEKLDEQTSELNQKKIEIEAKLKGTYRKEIEQIAKDYNEVFAPWPGAPEWGDLHSQKGDLIFNDIYQKKIDAVNRKYQGQLSLLDRINEKLKKNAETQALIETEVNQTNASLVNAKGFESVNSKLGEMGKQANHFLKRITRTGLAIFGIRSAYLAVRQAMSYVTSDNEKLGKQLDGMKKSFYTAFTPIIEKIINLIRTAMAYINALWKAFFGKDLFKNVVDTSKKTSDNLSSSAKSAKEINKQLAGFDEANVLSANQGSSGGGGGSADTSGSVNLGLDKVKFPKWFTDLTAWIEKHPTLSKIIFGLAPFVLFGLAKLGGALTKTALAKILGTAGAGATATGASGLLGILGTLALIAGTVVLVYFAAKGINELLDAYADFHTSQVRVENAMKDENKVLDEQAKRILADAEAGKVNNQQMNTYTSHLRNVIKETQAQIDSNVLNAEAQKEARKEIKKAADTYKILYDNGLLTEEQEYEYYKFLLNDYVPGLDLSTEHGQAMADTLEKLSGTYTLKFRTEKLEELRSLIDSTGDKITKMVNNPTFKKWIGGNANVQAAYNFLKEQGVLKYANGGIVNMPGRGVPLAIGGEAGREGVIPMDNEAQMSLLGREIAKYVNINNMINNYMDGRKINTILQQSANRERLANNG